MDFSRYVFGPRRLDRLPLPQKKKRPLILLELLISLTLGALLLSLLFTSITRVAKIETKLNTARAALLERQHFQMRLQDLFMGLKPNSPFYTQRFPHEKRDSLIATFKHGIDPESAFSGDVLGRIYFDRQQNLCLAIWPVHDPSLWRKEILFPNATDCQFRFLGPIRQEDAPQPITPTLAWHTHWSKERNDHPSLVRIAIGEKTAPLQFAFLLPSKSIVTYVEKGEVL